MPTYEEQLEALKKLPFGNQLAQKYQTYTGPYRYMQQAQRGPEDIQKNLSLYDELMKGQKEKLLSGFRTGTEAGVARQLEAAQRAATLRSQRAGLGRGGLGGRAAAMAEVGLRGAGEASMQDFRTRLGLLQSQQREAFVRGEFSFMNEMEKLVASMQFDQSMTMMREQLQRDRESRASFLGLAGGIGEWLGWGPVGTAFGGLFDGGQQQQPAA